MRSPEEVCSSFLDGERAAVRKICGKYIVLLLVCGYALSCIIGSNRVLHAIVRNSDKTANATFERTQRATATIVAWSLRKQNITEPRVQVFFTVISFLISSPHKNKYSPPFDLHSGSSLAGLPHFFPLPRDYPTAA